MSSAAGIEEALRARIREERAAMERKAGGDLRERILAGDHEEARAALFFFTKPRELDGVVERLCGELSAHFEKSTGAQKRAVLLFLTFFVVDLSSAASEWVVRKSLSAAALSETSERVSALLSRLAEAEPAIERELLQQLHRETAARLTAEGVTDISEMARIADAVAGRSLADFSRAILQEMEGSPLVAAARSCIAGKSETELGNDYADFLQHVIWRGGSFATTNPVLIKVAHDIDSARWDAEIDNALRRRHAPGAAARLLAEGGDRLEQAIDGVVADVTVAVVERNCRLLRPIFLVTGGRSGYVSLQVNPNNHDNPALMVRDAVSLHDELERRLGGVPNVVIKLPATGAALEAAETLVAKGIGVNMTLTFSVFQAVAFARVLSAGHSLVSYISIMNGRLAFPVRDELGRVGTRRDVDASRLAGVEVARKAFRRVYGKVSNVGLGVDPSRVRILIASLRIYDTWIPDVSELWGVPLITIFPNVRRAFETLKCSFVPGSLEGETPAEDIQCLLRSEIFKQAWWVDGDGKEDAPARKLTLERSDAAEMAKWTPIHETLTQFIGAYEQVCGLVRERMGIVAAPK